MIGMRPRRTGGFGIPVSCQDSDDASADGSCCNTFSIPFMYIHVPQALILVFVLMFRFLFPHFSSCTPSQKQAQLQNALKEIGLAWDDGSVQDILQRWGSSFEGLEVSRGGSQAHVLPWVAATVYRYVPLQAHGLLLVCPEYHRISSGFGDVLGPVSLHQL